MVELRQWHDDQMEELNAWRAGQLEDLRTHFTQSLEAERARADAAERELATYVATAPTVAAGPDRLVLRAVRVARRLASARREPVGRR